MKPHVTIYKFKDRTDNNYCYILAATAEDATATVKEITTLPVELVEERAFTVELLAAFIAKKKGIVIHNETLPF